MSFRNFLIIPISTKYTYKIAQSSRLFYKCVWYKTSIFLYYFQFTRCGLREGVAKVAPSYFGDFLQGVAG